MLLKTRIQDLYFNISEMKLSITSQYIISDAPKYAIIWTENSDVIDNFIPEILKYESSVIDWKILGHTINICTCFLGNTHTLSQNKYV